MDKEEIKQENTKRKKKIKLNIWMITTAVFALLFITSLVFRGGAGGITGKVISSQEAGGKVLGLINDHFIRDGYATLVSIEEESGLYKVNLLYQDQDTAVYVTKEGKYLIMPNGIMDIAQFEAMAQLPPSDTPEQENIQKTDKPVVEAFVFSYCPYGLQFQKALLPVYKMLKDKADIDLVAIGAMHGEYEKIESLRQICIEEEYGKDKLWGYLEEFMGDTEIGDCRENSECVKPLIENIFDKLEINKDKINSCIDIGAEKIYQSQNSRARELGISGSPIFVINNVRVNVGRNPEAIKEAICDAFTEMPDECAQTLSSQGVSPGFGYDESDSGSGGQC